MAKASIIMNKSLTMTGVLNTDNPEITLDFSDMGERNIRDFLSKFNGENIQIKISLKEENPEE